MCHHGSSNKSPDFLGLVQTPLKIFACCRCLHPIDLGRAGNCGEYPVQLLRLRVRVSLHFFRFSSRFANCCRRYCRSIRLISLAFRSFAADALPAWLINFLAQETCSIRLMLAWVMLAWLRYKMKLATWLETDTTHCFMDALTVHGSAAKFDEQQGHIQKEFLTAVDQCSWLALLR